MAILGTEKLAGENRPVRICPLKLAQVDLSIYSHLPPGNPVFLREIAPCKVMLQE
jgi:hypothetical protein